MYKDIATALDSHEIRYYIVYGSAIGTIREKGFVPWDDDMDLAVMEEDIPLVDKILKDDLDSEKYYYCPKGADYHPHVILKSEDMISKLRDRTAPFIDIFIIAPYPSKRRRVFPYKIAMWCELLSSNVIDRIGSVTIVRLFSWMVPFFGKIRNMISNSDTEYTTIVDYYFKKCIFKKSDYGKPVLKTFEDTTVPLPKEYDMMLKKIYGDYMSPPPEDERRGSTGFPCSALQEYIIKHPESKLEPCIFNKHHKR